MPVSKTTPGRLGARVIVRPSVLPSVSWNDVGTQDEGTFAAQWLAYALPQSTLRQYPHGYWRMDSGVDAVRYFLHRDGLATIYSLPVSRRTPL